VNFHGERRSNGTRASTTDPEAAWRRRRAAVKPVNADRINTDLLALLRT
jgi:hypothetical protein